MSEHKCVDCAFLSAKNLDSRNLDEVEGEFRRTGNPPLHLLGGREIYYPIHKGYPICFVQKYNLPDLFEKTSGQEPNKFLAIINEGRECDLFTEWKQGFTPKEHQEMIDRQRRLEFEACKDAEDKKWREGQEEKADQRHQDQIKLLKGIHRREMWIVGGAVTLVIIIVTIIGAAIEAGWFKIWFGLFG